MNFALMQDLCDSQDVVLTISIDEMMLESEKYCSEMAIALLVLFHSLHVACNATYDVEFHKQDILYWV